MPHTYECPMRWADMDMLGHVNNVTYLDYVAEARERLFPHGELGRSRVVRQQVEFVAPLVFRRRPVMVDSWVTDVGDDGTVALAHELYAAQAAAEDERVVHARVSTVVAVDPAGPQLHVPENLEGPRHEWRPVAADTGPGGDPHPLTVRRTDVDECGLVRDSAFFELFQEARIQLLMSLHTRGQRWSHHVVARTDIDFWEPVPHRHEPYAVRSWIGHVGTRSFTVGTQMLDDERPLAQAAVVMVIFDPETQRPTDMSSTQRARLLEELAT